jgi:hypothetical protein
MNGAIMKLLFQTISRVLIIGATLSIATVVASAQSARLQLETLDHLAPKASETVDVNLDERLIQVAAKVFSDRDVDERQIKDLIKNLKGVYVKSFEFEGTNNYTEADVEAIRSQLRSPGWSRLVNVRSKREGIVEVYVHLSGDTVGGLVVLSLEEKELTVINIVGPVDLEKLASLEGNFGIPDLDLTTPKVKTKNEL